MNKHSLILSPRTGHIVGMMHALAAVGSIVGTFAAGYWLIPALGSRAVVLASSTALLALALPLLRRAGGGAYTQPRAAGALYPAGRATVAELDPLVTKTARERLFVDTSTMIIYHNDARNVLARDLDGRYDVIVADAFHDIAVPYHLVTRELAELVKQRLRPGGLYTLNVVDAFPNGRLVKAMLKTLSQVFTHVDVWLEELAQEPVRLTYVISASDRGGWPEALSATRGLPRQWLSITEALRTIGTPESELPLLTDDHAPVERLMAQLFLSSLGR